mmetsp:Transcript_1665/g.4666  ORF Transcript_1665/g.4666 Transcript_1665/m.4666 type:complete len:525 (+) Transcript_1665:785-2359(+)
MLARVRLHRHLHSGSTERTNQGHLDAAEPQFRASHLEQSFHPLYELVTQLGLPLHVPLHVLQVLVLVKLHDHHEIPGIPGTHRNRVEAPVGISADVDDHVSRVVTKVLVAAPVVNLDVPAVERHVRRLRQMDSVLDLVLHEQAGQPQVNLLGRRAEKGSVGFVIEHKPPPVGADVLPIHVLVLPAFSCHGIVLAQLERRAGDVEGVCHEHPALEAHLDLRRLVLSRSHNALDVLPDATILALQHRVLRQERCADRNTVVAANAVHHNGCRRTGGRPRSSGPALLPERRPELSVHGRLLHGLPLDPQLERAPGTLTDAELYRVVPHPRETPHQGGSVLPLAQQSQRVLPGVQRSHGVHHVLPEHLVVVRIPEPPHLHHLVVHQLDDEPRVYVWVHRLLQTTRERTGDEKVLTVGGSVLHTHVAPRIQRKLLQQVRQLVPLRHGTQGRHPRLRPAHEQAKHLVQLRDSKDVRHHVLQPNVIPFHGKIHQSIHLLHLLPQVRRKLPQVSLRRLRVTRGLHGATEATR